MSKHKQSMASQMVEDQIKHYSSNIATYASEMQAMLYKENHLVDREKKYDGKTLHSPASTNLTRTMLTATRMKRKLKKYMTEI